MACATTPVACATTAMVCATTAMACATTAMACASAAMACASAAMACASAGVTAAKVGSAGSDAPSIVAHLVGTKECKKKHMRVHEDRLKGEFRKVTSPTDLALAMCIVHVGLKKK